jgi:polyisoprenoid-binding protein YceI
MRWLATSWLSWLALVLPAQAVEFNRLLPEQSRIAFVSTQMGAEVVGGFSVFRADLAFDPARPAAARALVEIDLASVDAGSNEGNEAVKGADWLRVAAYPRARFESTSVRALGRGRYEARGRLTLRGHSRDVKLRFTFRQLGPHGLFEGRIDLRRLDYGIGQAVWGDTGVVADVVRIQFWLVADSDVASPVRRPR